MKIVKICLFLLIISFTAGCWAFEDEDLKENHDDSYGFCDFTYKGIKYHFENEFSFDPVRCLFPDSRGFYSFEFGTISGYNRLSIYLDADDPAENQGKPMCSTRIVNNISLYINGFECGTISNYGTITITHWDYKGGDGAEYNMSTCKGSFSGTIVESDGSEFPIEGTFEGSVDDVD